MSVDTNDDGSANNGSNGFDVLVEVSFWDGPVQLNLFASFDSAVINGLQVP